MTGTKVILWLAGIFAFGFFFANKQRAKITIVVVIIVGLAYIFMNRPDIVEKIPLPKIQIGVE